MKPKQKRVSLGDIARAAGVSAVAVSRALQNKPGVSAITRERILAIARQLNYTPNAGLSSVMAQVRKSVSQDLLPIAWLNTSWEKDSWKLHLFHTPYIDGARTRAKELGYRLEELWVHEPGMTMKRLAKILYQRRIEGAIVTHPARHLRLDWSHLASVAIGSSLLAPRLHRVTADITFNFYLVLKALRRLGYRRIGICLWSEVDSSSQHTLRAISRDLYYSTPSTHRIPPMFHPLRTRYEMEARGGEIANVMGREMLRWYVRHRPEVIVGHDNRLKGWLESSGYRVPADVGLVHLAVDDDVLDWAGIQSHRRDVGAMAVEWLVSLMRNANFGVPRRPLNILVRGTWQTGRTLKPRP